MSEMEPNSFFKVIATSELFQGGKVLVPKKVRDLLHVEDNGSIIWIQYGNKILVDTAARDQFFRPVWRTAISKEDAKKEEAEEKARSNDESAKADT